MVLSSSCRDERRPSTESKRVLFSNSSSTAFDSEPSNSERTLSAETGFFGPLKSTIDAAERSLFRRFPTISDSSLGTPRLKPSSDPSYSMICRAFNDAKASMTSSILSLVPAASKRPMRCVLIWDIS